MKRIALTLPLLGFVSIGAGTAIPFVDSFLASGFYLLDLHMRKYRRTDNQPNIWGSEYPTPACNVEGLLCWSWTV